MGAETPDLFLIVNMCRGKNNTWETESGRRIKNREKRPRNQDSDIENSPLAAAAAVRWQQETKQATPHMLERARPPSVRERIRGSACTDTSACECACKLIPSRGRQMGAMGL